VKSIFSFVLLLTASLLPAQAALISFDSIDTGWYAENGAHPVNSSNIWTGLDNKGVIRNSFFNFDVSSLGAVVISSARLLISSNGVYRSPDLSETVQFRGVDGVPGNGFSSGIYSDLESGTLYGELDVFGTNKQAMPDVAVNLSSLSFDDILNDNFFSIGASLSSLAAGAQQTLWWGIETLPSVKLIVEYDENSVKVTEPTTAGLFGFLLVAIASIRRLSAKSTKYSL